MAVPLTRKRLAALAVAVIAALAACENVPGRDETSDPPLSKDAFVRRANAICRESQTEAQALPAPSLADQVAVEASIREAAAVQRRAVRRLRSLEPPETDAPGVKNWLGLAGDAIAEMESLADAVAAGDRAAMEEAIARGDELTSDAEAFTAAYGLHDCSIEEPPDDEE
jgi:hypothetical protein